MVRQITSKILSIVIVAVVLMLPLGSIALATDYTAYDGNISSTYTQYFKDIIADVPITDNYVYFRSGQYTYDLVIGDIEFNDGVFVLLGEGKQYTITNNSNNYSSYYVYNVQDINHFTLIPDDKFVYSDLGDYPQLEGRSEKFEILQTITIVVACLYVVIRSIFNSSKC